MTHLVHSKTHDEGEELLTQNKSRYVLYPIQYADIFHMYKKAVSSFWTSDEINMEQDIQDLQRLNENEKQFILSVLAFFGSSDSVVMENLAARFMKEVQVSEAINFYAFQMAIEAIHSETYSLMIDTLARDAGEKERLFNAITHFPAIAEKQQWGLKWIDHPEASFAQRLVGFALIEGVFFSASFCCLFWLRERGLCPGLTFSNQLISRDESLHTEFACLLYSKIHHRVSADIVEEMVREAVDIEERFITESIPCSMIGMNAALMKEYIHFIADRMMLMLGYDKLFHAHNPFPFMEFSATDAKSNFFEQREASYSKATVSFTPGKSAVPGELNINLADDF